MPIVKDAQLYSRAEIDKMIADVKKAAEDAAKNSGSGSGSAGGGGSGGTENFPGKYNIYAMIGASYDYHGNARFSLGSVIFIYSENFNPSEKLPAIRTGFPAYNFPNSFYGFIPVNGTQWTFSYSIMRNWYASYRDQYIYNLEKAIEQNYSYIKFSSLHNGSGNATLHFTTNYLYTFQNMGDTLADIIRFNSDVDYFRQDSARNHNNPPYSKNLVALTFNVGLCPSESDIKRIF